MNPTPRARARRRLSAAQRREQILEAAVETFAERGYAGASMGEIAARAGVVASVIYDHFSSKRTPHIELLELHGAALIERTIVGMSGVPPEHLVRVGVDAFYRFMEDDPFVWRFLFRDPPMDPEIAAVWRRDPRTRNCGTRGLIRSALPSAETLFGVPGRTRERDARPERQETVEGLAEWWWEHREVARAEVVLVATGLLWEGFKTLLERARGLPGREASAVSASVLP